jgi:hypothetical protein
MSKAAARWNAEHDPQASLLISWFEEHVLATGRATPAAARRTSYTSDRTSGAPARHPQRHAHASTDSPTIIINRSTNGPKVILRSGTVVHPHGVLEVGCPSGSATCATAVA